MTTEASSLIDIPRLIALIKRDRARLYRGRFSTLDKELGQSRAYLTRGLRGARQLRMSEVLQLIDLFGYTPDEYMTRLSGRPKVFGVMPVDFLRTRRKKDRRSKPSALYAWFCDWIGRVTVTDAGDDLRFLPYEHSKLLGAAKSQHDATFGEVLLEILAAENPDHLTRRAAHELGQTFLLLARSALTSARPGVALDFLDLTVRLERQFTDFDLRSQMFLVAAEALHSLGFSKDAAWCAYEGTLLALGTGSLARVSAGRTLHLRYQDAFEPEDDMMHLLRSVSDERRASGLILGREVVDRPLGGQPYLFTRLLKGSHRSKLTMDRWLAFTEKLVTPFDLRRGFRRLTVPAVGSNLIESELDHEALVGNPLSPQEHQYVAWLKQVGISLDSEAEIEIAFPPHRKASKFLEYPQTAEISWSDALRHAMALGTMAQNKRLSDDFLGARDLFIAAFELEERLSSPSLRAQLYQLSSYFWVATGRYLQGHLAAFRAVSLEIHTGDPKGLAKACFALATMEMLGGRFSQAVWLFESTLTLAELNKSFTAGAHYSIGFCCLKLERLADAQKALEKAESLDTASLYPNICYLHGAICSAQGLEHEATEWFSRAGKAFEQLGLSFDRILFALHHVAHLIRYGRVKEAILEVRTVREMAPRLGSNKIIHVALNELSQKTRQGLLTLSLVEHIRHRIECPWEANQPFGSTPGKTQPVGGSSLSSADSSARGLT